jgi:hypothetical protein
MLSAVVVPVGDEVPFVEALTRRLTQSGPDDKNAFNEAVVKNQQLFSLIALKSAIN